MTWRALIRPRQLAVEVSVGASKNSNFFCKKFQISSQPPINTPTWFHSFHTPLHLISLLHSPKSSPPCRVGLQISPHSPISCSPTGHQPLPKMISLRHIVAPMSVLRRIPEYYSPPAHHLRGHMVHTVHLRGHMLHTLRIHTPHHLHMLHLQVAGVGLYLRTHHLRTVHMLHLHMLHTRHMLHTPHHLPKPLLQAPGPKPQKQSYQSVQRGLIGQLRTRKNW